MRKALLASLLAVALVPAVLAADDDHKVVVSSDKLTEITVPSSWTDLELNKQAEIQVGNETDEAYLIVLNELKEDLDGWNLDKHSRVTLGTLLASIANPVVTGPKSLTVDGHPALQYEIRGSSDGRKITYIHTTVDGEKLFSQILAWTLPSKGDQVKPQLVRAINSFHERK